MTATLTISRLHDLRLGAMAQALQLVVQPGHTGPRQRLARRLYALSAGLLFALAHVPDSQVTKRCRATFPNAYPMCAVVSLHGQAAYQLIQSLISLGGGQHMAR